MANQTKPETFFFWLYKTRTRNKFFFPLTLGVELSTQADGTPSFHHLATVFAAKDRMAGQKPHEDCTPQKIQTFLFSKISYSCIAKTRHFFCSQKVENENVGGRGIKIKGKEFHTPIVLA